MFAILVSTVKKKKVSLLISLILIFVILEVRNFCTIDATPAFVNDPFTYLKKSHRSLLMFRRTSKDGRLELRHQRTGDVVFDWRDEMKPWQKPDFYLYRLIEILLPKAMVN
tara:strand:+ start:294 stop:626 length:333 start_codon:yes stop_codon:yes gene_type:complete